MIAAKQTQKTGDCNTNRTSKRNERKQQNWAVTQKKSMQIKKKKTLKTNSVKMSSHAKSVQEVELHAPKAQRAVPRSVDNIKSYSPHHPIDPKAVKVTTVVEVEDERSKNEKRAEYREQKHQKQKGKNPKRIEKRVEKFDD
ncbi:hypothetical protein EIN_171570 [Entamoeba invadens IP1]|uniref:Uncharacterized protein n=1 Tax=Entamoeba invadens IP1 TaxID=370355 RepID=A0A0A1TVS8_ENTIV|nr:hypothetical protein EIN_171570 [Entamoeba invadens IP1]ELP84582.1 hypothetical protein EIN_171570 [Entamoeba invadens IP1]|eukprot:XP_004183928.1 hypothetical protein EIN_171570 [Entamoeba invadens IP1]